MLNQFLTGAMTIGLLAAGMFFLRFWRKTRDRLFAIFALAFWVLAAERILLALTSPTDELRPFIYMVRLFAFILIIVAIVDKNRTQRG